MEGPDYLICINCETPCYSFEWRQGALVEIMCLACGSEETDEFTTAEEFEAMASLG